MYFLKLIDYNFIIDKMPITMMSFFITLKIVARIFSNGHVISSNQGQRNANKESKRTSPFSLFVVDTVQIGNTHR